MSTIDTIRHSQPRLRGFMSILAAAVVLLDDIATKQRSCRALLELTDEQLKDVGLSKSDAYREGIRTAWDQ